MKKMFFLTFLASLFLGGCKEKITKSREHVMAPAATPQENVDLHATRNSVDWDGRYKGLLPCADCEGIEMEIELKKDNTYVAKSRYRGRPNPNEFSYTGKFTWDASGSGIRLEGLEDGPTYFQVGEGHMTQLDSQGKKISGQHADKYILRK
ncbi:MAG: copper resistance protein NlpE [Adhaeribacter sp.]